jgi:thiamine-phosphate pyrophosphorylase
MTLQERFIAARLYVITCPPSAGKEGYAPMVEAACAGGADIVQFRDKDLSIKDRYEVGLRLAEICYERGALLIVNDAIDLALAIGADGVHLGQDDLPQDVARELIKRFGAKEFLIGRSTHSLAQAQKAEEDGVDYIAIGPVFATPTKPAYAAVGLELVTQVTRAVKTPHVAIGGISEENVPQVMNAGAQRVAVVRAACGQDDVAFAVQRLKKAISNTPSPLAGEGARRAGEGLNIGLVPSSGLRPPSPARGEGSGK